MYTTISENKSFFKNVVSLLIPYKKKVITIFVTMVLYGMVSAFTPKCTQYFVDKGILGQNITFMLFCLGILLVFGILQIMIDYMQFTLCFTLEKNMQFKLLYLGFNKMLRLKVYKYSQNNYYVISENLRNDVNTISTLVDRNVIFSFTQFFQILGGLIGLIWVNWRLIVLLVLIIPLKLILIQFFSILQEKTFKQEMDCFEKYFGFWGDIIQNIKVIKLWNLYSYERKHLKKIYRDLKKISYKSQKYNKIHSVLNMFLDLLFQITAYFLGGFLIFKGKMTIGGLIAFFTYAGLIVNPINLISFVKKEMSKIKPALERYIDLITSEEEKKKRTKNSNFSLETFIPQQIIFDHVSYTVSQNKVLDSVSFSINHGEKVAVLGKNGSGKTTILNLLLRLCEPTSGCILFDNVDIRYFDIDAYRDMITIVPQELTFFNSTLLDNICFKPCRDKLDTLKNNLLKTEMENVLNQLKKFFYREIGNNGMYLSGGEKQKLALVRAVNKNANIFILDEASSNFDVESIKMFKKFLRNKVSSYDFVFVITHQKEILEEMDKIITISDGVVTGISNKTEESGE